MRHRRDKASLRLVLHCRDASPCVWRLTEEQKNASRTGREMISRQKWEGYHLFSLKTNRNRQWLSQTMRSESWGGGWVTSHCLPKNGREGASSTPRAAGSSSRTPRTEWEGNSAASSQHQLLYSFLLQVLTLWFEDISTYLFWMTLLHAHEDRI